MTQKSLQLLFLICFSGSLLVKTVVVANDDAVGVSKRVDFKANVSPYQWNAIFIELTANKNIAPDTRNSRYVDHIKVILTLGYKLAKQEFAFYQAAVTLVALEQNNSARIAFFMPREIVQRDNLDTEPEYWTVDLVVDGEPLPMRRDRSSRSINNAEQLQYFRNAYAAAIAETKGILVPAHLSPYGYGFGAKREPPAIIWHLPHQEDLQP